MLDRFMWAWTIGCHVRMSFDGVVYRRVPHKTAVKSSSVELGHDVITILSAGLFPLKKNKN